MHAMRTGFRYFIALVFALLANAGLGADASPPATALSALEGLSAEVPVEAVAARGLNGFTAFDSKKVYATGTGKAVWVHLVLDPRSTTDPEPQALVLALENNIVERLTLYYQDKSGQWRSELAGRGVARTQWAHNQIYPSFVLPRPLAQPMHLYLKVQHPVPRRLELVLMPAAQAEATLRWALVHAVALQTFIAVIAFFCLALSLFYRQRLYALYGLYVSLAFFAAACYNGLAATFLWPSATT